MRQVWRLYGDVCDPAQEQARTALQRRPQQMREWQTLAPMALAARLRWLKRDDPSAVPVSVAPVLSIAFTALARPRLLARSQPRLSYVPPIKFSLPNPHIFLLAADAAAGRGPRHGRPGGRAGGGGVGVREHGAAAERHRVLPAPGQPGSSRRHRTHARPHTGAAAVRHNRTTQLYDTTVRLYCRACGAGRVCFCVSVFL